jgi:hypothetical protein
VEVEGVVDATMIEEQAGLGDQVYTYIARGMQRLSGTLRRPPTFHLLSMEGGQKFGI